MCIRDRTYSYKAEIVGNFNENQYPNDEVLDLKVGAQIMFIRNDASGERRYFNGKLAEVVDLDEKEITVIIAVSYTHLDVYKRQIVLRLLRFKCRISTHQNRFSIHTSNSCLLYTSRCV